MNITISNLTININIKDKTMSEWLDKNLELLNTVSFYDCKSEDCLKAVDELKASIAEKVTLDEEQSALIDAIIKKIAENPAVPPVETVTEEAPVAPIEENAPVEDPVITN